MRKHYDWKNLDRNQEGEKTTGVLSLDRDPLSVRPITDSLLVVNTSLIWVMDGTENTRYSISTENYINLYYKYIVGFKGFP